MKSENFSEIWANLNQEEMHHCLDLRGWTALTVHFSPRLNERFYDVQMRVFRHGN